MPQVCFSIVVTSVDLYSNNRSYNFVTALGQVIISCGILDRVVRVQHTLDHVTGAESYLSVLPAVPSGYGRVFGEAYGCLFHVVIIVEIRVNGNRKTPLVAWGCGCVSVWSAYR